MATLLSIKRTYEQHKKENPRSFLSERTIRNAVKNRELPAIMSGNRMLVCDETFSKWIRGELYGKEE